MLIEGVLSKLCQHITSNIDIFMNKAASPQLQLPRISQGQTGQLCCFPVAIYHPLFSVCSSSRSPLTLFPASSSPPPPAHPSIFLPLLHIIPPPVSLITAPLIPVETVNSGFTVMQDGKERTGL